MRLQFQYGDELITLHVEPDGLAWRIRLPDGTEHRVTIRSDVDDVLQISEANGEISGEMSGLRAFRVPFARLDRGTGFSYQGATYIFAAPSPRALDKSKTASGVLLSPMAGVVADVMVTEGQTVEAYQPLAVIEAMKVMSTLDAPFAGTVKTVHVQPKQQVAHGAPIIEIVPDLKVAANERK